MTPPHHLPDQPFQKGKAEKIIHSKTPTHGPFYIPFKGINISPFKSYSLAKYDSIFYLYTGEYKMNFLYYAKISLMVCCYVFTVL